MRVGALALGQPEIDEDAARVRGRVQEVGGLDVAVQDVVVVHGAQRGEERVEVVSHLGDGEVAEVLAEVAVLEVG